MLTLIRALQGAVVCAVVAALAIVSVYPAAAAPGGYTLPVPPGMNFLKTQGFGGGHAGFDYQLGNYSTGGEGVVAARLSVASGTTATFQPGPGGYGHYVDVDHSSGFSTRYAHLASAGPNGVTVQRGEQIGNEGNSGGPWCQNPDCTIIASPYHLHFETRINGAAVNPDTQWSTNPPSYYQGTVTAGVWRDRSWYLNNAHQGGSVQPFDYGLTTDKPVTGDWDGDGDDTIGVRRGCEWHLRDSNSAGDATITPFCCGQASDIPVVGDWDGDGDYTVGIRRGCEWHLRDSNSAGGATISPFCYGQASDIPVVGDWDGDGDVTVGIRRGCEWHLRDSNSAGGATITPFCYGQASDIPIVGDWDGDGVDTIGVVRNGQWLLRNSNSSGANDVPAYIFGTASDTPISGDWNGQ